MKTAIALGTFDGLHAGHRAVLEKTSSFFSIAVTFDIPPKSAASGEAQLLMLPDDREKRLKQLGIDRVVMQDFEKVKNISAQNYLEMLKREYLPQRIVCGFNYRFGKDATGDTDLLAQFCRKNSIEFICVPPVKKDGKVLSSTNIRSLIREGDMSNAASEIYGGFSFITPVLHGDERGRTIGFPTANQAYPQLLIKPKLGVYISRVTVDGNKYDAITNIGVRPTYKTENVACETYIKAFSGEIYGKQMKTELIRFVREEQKFLSLDELKKAIANDVELLG